MEDLPLIITVFFLGAFLLMVAALFVGSSVFKVGGEEPVNLVTLEAVFLDFETYVLLWETLKIGIVTGAVGVVIGGIYVWIVVRTNVPYKRWLRVMAISPIMMPGIVKTFGWIAAFSPEIGIINVIARNVFGIKILFNVYSFWGIIIAIGFSSISVSFLILEPALRSLSYDLEEASRISGRGPIQTFIRVTVPLMVPGLASAFLLISIYAFGNFEYPLLFGALSGAGIETLATEIYIVIAHDPTPEYGTASVLSMIYMIVALLMVGVYHYLTKKTFRFETIGGKGGRDNTMDLGAFKYFGLGICMLIWIFAFIIPFGGVLLISLAPNLGDVPGLTVALSAITLRNFAGFFELTSIMTVVKNSILVAFGAAVGVTVFSTFISYLTLKTDYSFARVGDYVSTIPLGIPPIVYGLAIFWMVLLIPGLSMTYGTIFPLILAIMFLKIPHGVRMISTNLIQITDELEEASRVAGWSWWDGFKKIVSPLLLGGISNCFLYVLIEGLKELAAIALLITAGNTVFTGLILSWYSQSPGALPKIAAGSLMFSAGLAIIAAMQTKLNEIGYY